MLIPRYNLLQHFNSCTCRITILSQSRCITNYAQAALQIMLKPHYNSFSHAMLQFQLKLRYNLCWYRITIYAHATLHFILTLHYNLCSCHITIYAHSALEFMLMQYYNLCSCHITTYAHAALQIILMLHYNSFSLCVTIHFHAALQIMLMVINFTIFAQAALQSWHRPLQNLPLGVLYAANFGLAATPFTLTFPPTIFFIIDS